VDYLESVGGNKKRVAEPSFLCNFQTKVIRTKYEEPAGVRYVKEDE
jgi:hypothetical protein